VIYLFFWVRKLVLQWKGYFEISKVEVDDNSSYCYLRLQRPKNYKHVEGQYAFFNCPDVSGTQWHPFSICSSEFSPYVSFLIKNSGDFTGKLIKKFKECLDSRTETEHSVNETVSYINISNI
jgi:predicted ferric reductase